MTGMTEMAMTAEWLLTAIIDKCFVFSAFFKLFLLFNVQVDVDVILLTFSNSIKCQLTQKKTCKQKNAKKVT